MRGASIVSVGCEVLTAMHIRVPLGELGPSSLRETFHDGVEAPERVKFGSGEALPERARDAGNPGAAAGDAHDLDLGRSHPSCFERGVESRDDARHFVAARRFELFERECLFDLDSGIACIPCSA